MSLYDSRDMEDLNALLDKVGHAACAAHQSELVLREARHELVEFVEKLLEEQEK
jgi:hypothetical protein